MRGNITVDEGSSIIIEHQGNLVQVNEDAVVTNNGTINVNLTTPELIARDFMLLGSPMSGDDENVFNAQAMLFHTTSNFDPYEGTPAISGVNFVDQDNNDWSHQVGVLNPAEGYLVRPSMTQGGTYDYTYSQGTLNSGTISYNATFGDDKQDSPNILANPYASAIDASMFISQNANVSEVYFWEHNTTPSNTFPGGNSANFSMEDVSMFNGLMGVQASSGGSTPNAVISTGQGFGIKANAGGSITFTNAMRLTSGNTTLRNQEDKDLLWITVSDNQYDLGSTAGLGFIASASERLRSKV